MLASQIPGDFVARFGATGSTINISNLTSMIVDDDDRFTYEGAVRSLAIEGDELVVEFEWLAEKTAEGGWQFVNDPTLLTFRHSLQLFMRGASPDNGRYIFFPMEPIVHEQVLCVAHDYVGPTGRRPLTREQVQPAA